MPRRGYVYMVLFSLFISVSGAIKYRVYIKRDFNQVIYQHLVLQTLFYIPSICDSGITSCSLVL